MSKWIRIDDQDNIQEVINYDPNGVINEAFLPSFKGPFDDDVALGYFYNSVTGTCTLPTGYVYDAGSESYVDPNPPSRPPSPPEPEQPKDPVYIELDLFRSQLTLTEKLIWDSPDTATTVQRQAIVTVKSDFPQRVDGDQFREELDLLESTEVISSGRSATLLTYFSSL